MTDLQLTELLFQREENVLETIRVQYGAYCHCIAKNIPQNTEDAEECVADALVQVWNSVPPEQPANMKHYLACITRNLALNRYQAQHSQKRGGGELPLALEELDGCLRSLDDVEKTIEGRLLNECIARFVTELSARERGIFLRRYYCFESVADIAKRYDLRQGNVHMILSRTRKKLKTYLKKEGF